MDLNQVTVLCTDHAASLRFYRGLGPRQIVDEPQHDAGFAGPADPGPASPPQARPRLCREAYLLDLAGNSVSMPGAGESRKSRPRRLRGG